MSLGRSLVEKKADSYVYRRSTHVDKNPAFRLAGKIFQEKDYLDEKVRSERSSLMKSRPTGYGFGNKDEYGPDNDYSSVESLRRIHDRDHYIVGGNHGFAPPSV